MKLKPWLRNNDPPSQPPFMTTLELLFANMNKTVCRVAPRP